MVALLQIHVTCAFCREKIETQIQLIAKRKRHTINNVWSHTKFCGISRSEQKMNYSMAFSKLRTRWICLFRRWAVHSELTHVQCHLRPLSDNLQHYWWAMDLEKKITQCIVSWQCWCLNFSAGSIEMETVYFILVL